MPAKRAGSPSGPDGFSLYGKSIEEINGGRRFDRLLLTGVEEYLIRKARDQYLHVAVDPAYADFDLTEFRGSEISASTLWDALTTMPFGTGRRTVVIDEPGEIKRKDVLEAISKFLASPSSASNLVLVQPLEDKRDRPPAWATKNIDVLEFTELNSSSRSRWIKQFVDDKEKSLSQEALVYLIESSQPRLDDISSKLEHAVLYVGEEKEISIQAIMAVSGVTSEFTVFNLEDELLKGRPKEATRIARSLLSGGEAFLLMIGRARTFALKTWQVSSAMGRQDESALIYQILGGQNFKKQDFINCAGRLGVESLQDRILDLMDIEKHFKSKTSDPLPLYYRWIWSMSS